jgi:drug/metabolite transporter (DMT)-like permease
MPFLVANTLRYLTSILVLSVAQRFSGQKAPLRSVPLRFFITVLIEAFGGSSIFVYGLSHSDLSIAAPLSSLAPLFAVPMGLLLGTETLSARRLAAIVLTVTGVILLVR